MSKPDTRELREAIGSIIGNEKQISEGRPAWFRQHTFELSLKNYHLESVNVEDEIDELLAIFAHHQKQAEIALNDIEDWVKRGLDPTNTNKDVPYRCLQLIGDRIKSMRKEL